MSCDDESLPVGSAAALADVDLAALAAGGCTASFAILTNRHEVAIVHYLRRLLARRGGPRARCDAEDVAQETFLRAWRGLRHYDPRHPFPAWLFTIGRNTCLNHLRSERRHADQLDRAAQARAPRSASAAASEPAAGGAADSLWGLAADLLPERQFTALWLRYVEDMPAAAIARVLESSTVGARLTLLRGRRRLEAAIRATEAAATDGALTAVPLAPLLSPLTRPAS